MNPRSRRFWIVGLLVTLLIAGVASWYASGSPDGLEWAAEKAGFVNTAQDSAVAGSPLADYSISGVENGRLSGGLAGVLGVLATLAIVGGLTLLLRRRGTGDRTDEDAAQPTASR